MKQLLADYLGIWFGFVEKWEFEQSSVSAGLERGKSVGEPFYRVDYFTHKEFHTNSTSGLVEMGGTATAEIPLQDLLVFIYNKDK